jgi:putative FmdB family regulatory protein
MPIFEVECSKCKGKSEIWCKFSEIEEQESECCSASVKQVVTGTDFRLKGAGWPGLSMQDYDKGKKRYRKD